MTKIFLSYAREDNKSVDQSKPGWVSYFHQTLAQELPAWGVLDAELWRDKQEIREYEQFADDIEAGLKDADVLISVVSPVYIQKDWCMRELERFAALKGTSTRNEREALVKVLKRPIDRDEEPESLRGQEGYRFFAVDPESGRYVDYYHPGRSKPQDAFFDEVVKLAQDLAEKLQSAHEPETEPDEDQSPRGTVFLGFTTGDLAGQARQARGEMESNRFSVLPEHNASPPVEQSEFAALLDETLATADHAVLLLGRSPGFTPDGGATPIIDMQLEAAKRAGVRRIIWAPPAQRDEHMTQLLNDLRSGKTLLETDELIEDSFDQLKGVLKGLGTEPVKPSAPDGADPLQAMIANMSEAQRAALMQALSGGKPNG